MSACTYLAYEVRGRRVTTIEGLADESGRLHPLQQAFLDNFAFQCGFCTPGMILAAKALLDEKPDATDAEIIAHMDGNLCRCTGYLPILKAIRQASARNAGAEVTERSEFISRQSFRPSRGRHRESDGQRALCQRHGGGAHGVGQAAAQPVCARAHSIDRRFRG